jgi:hypothetical protein
MMKRRISLPQIELEPLKKHKDVERKSSKSIEAPPRKPSQQQINAALSVGVPKFLVQKWLNIEGPKSKFNQKSCQVDNEEDISEYSEYSMTSMSQQNAESTKEIKEMSKFVAAKKNPPSKRNSSTSQFK